MRVTHKCIDGVMVHGRSLNRKEWEVFSIVRREIYLKSLQSLNDAMSIHAKNSK